ncbi:DUF6531 domain-containing protein [Luteimonas sp. SX5]|uniref:DUF6531 domain-containing protein n=1 Tax=Luteimonas galliterrae TaxID=2940486 RepID=A0ABT0MFJ9_9GAMM|nr:DUF6531 domain-containing protein [Luteimonas galliterrae]
MTTLTKDGGDSRSPTAASKTASSLDSRGLCLHHLFQIVALLLLILCGSAKAEFYDVPWKWHVQLEGRCPYEDHFGTADTIPLASAAQWEAEQRCVRPIFNDHYEIIYKYWGASTRTFAPNGAYRDLGIIGTVYQYDPGTNLGKQDCNANVTCGNPITISIGNKFQREPDFSNDSALELTRYYNSHKAARSDGFGRHWTHSYSFRLEHLTNPDTGEARVRIYRPDGGHVNFTKSGAVWTAPTNVVGTLVEHRDTNGVLLGWFYAPSDGRVLESYDLLGRLALIDNSDGTTTQFEYNDGVVENNADDYLLTKVVDPEGRSLLFEYDPSGHVIAVTDPTGAEYQYGYDLEGRLASVTFPGGAQRLYHYNEPSLNGGYSQPTALTGITSEDGQRYATFAYDVFERAVSTEHALSTSKFSIQYVGDSSPTSATVTLPLGETQQIGFNTFLGSRRATSLTRQCSGCPTNTSSYSYDVNGRMDLVTDSSSVTFDYDYDGRGLLTQQVDAANNASGIRRTTQTDWHSTYDVPVERRRRDANNTLVGKDNWTYNARGQELTATQTDPTTSATRITTTTYCEQADITNGLCPLLGLLTSTNGPRTDVADTTTYTYYASDEGSCASSPTTCPHRKGDLWKVTDALGRVTETLAYDGAGRVLSVKDANNVVTDFTYHPRGWLTARKVRGTNNASEADDQITTIEYWPTGLVKKVTQPDGAFTAYTYDAAHRLTDIADNAGNTIHYTLDNAGNRTAEDTKDAGNVLRRTLSRVYNQLGQLQTAKDAYNHATGFTYDANGNNQTVTDALNRVADNDYDPLNRLVRTLQDVGGIEAETKFAYDAQDNLTKVTDPKGLDTTYTYNGFSDLTQLSSPDTGVTTYTYDSAGNRKTQTDARNITATYSYDALNRLTGIAYPTSSLNVTYAYDTVNASCIAGETFAIGRMTKMIDGSGNTQYCYDRFGNVTRKRQTTNSQAFELRYAYTKAGQLQAITYPDGTVVDYARNGQGRTTEIGVTRSGGARQILLNQATYYPFGPVAAWTYGNGRTMTRSLNQNYQPLAIADVASGGLSLGFEFDAIGNLKKLYSADQVIIKAQYSYDTLNRLTDVKDGPTGTVIDHYTYDATGNRTSLTNAGGTTNYTYPITSHRLTQVGTVARTYDNAGNTVQIGGTARQFVYDNRGRLRQVKAGSTVTMNYVLNAHGQQVRRYLGTSNSYSLYDEEGRWLGEYSAGGVPVQQAIWLDDLPTGLLAGSGTTQKLHYLQPDHLATPRTVIDQALNTVIWRWDLNGDAFGNTVPNQDPDGNGTTFVMDLRFPGQRYDAASGLNYNYYRNYESATGRYSQSDPLGQTAGVSTYGYVSASPLIWADFWGLLQWLKNPIQWSPTLTTGLETQTYPGSGYGAPAAPSLGARTTIDWVITPTCKCENNDYFLQEYSVAFTPIVYLRQSYLSPKIRGEIKEDEREHVGDLLGWVDSAKAGAERLEQSMKSKSAKTMEACVNDATLRMQEYLAPSADAAVEASYKRYDASKRHRVVVPE